MDETVHELVKRFAERHGMGITESYGHLIYSLVDEEGNYRKPPSESYVKLSEDTYQEVKKAADRLGWPLEQLVERMLWTVIILYSKKIPLSDALKPISEILKAI
ncbi:MAG: hypothetical protein ACE5Z5_05715 [Candidatus Bathyarchaeia archaeon]